MDRKNTLHTIRNEIFEQECGLTYSRDGKVTYPGMTKKMIEIYNLDQFKCPND